MIQDGGHVGHAQDSTHADWFMMMSSLLHHPQLI